jgi:hypothetical protein
MAGLSVAPEATFPEAIQGWRCWRILPFKRLDGSETFRLNAVGTLGLPKTWEPLKPTVAVCSSYRQDVSLSPPNATTLKRAAPRCTWP